MQRFITDERTGIRYELIGDYYYPCLTVEKSLKEFGCNLHNYNPYRDSDIPVFREEKANWF